MLNPLKFLTSGVVNSVEKIALEFIDTDKESAEAKSMFVKVLDPNGKMRRDLSTFASRAYGCYLAVALFLITMHYFGFGEPEQSEQALAAITELFRPITTSWGLIVAASFGVNATNSVKDAK
tara:strand:+ start:183 stop:548 length:366 start_codon:yes stop_codon:yes gene_type:complete